MNPVLLLALAQPSPFLDPHAYPSPYSLDRKVALVLSAFFLLWLLALVYLTIRRHRIVDGRILPPGTPATETAGRVSRALAHWPVFTVLAALLVLLPFSMGAFGALSDYRNLEVQVRGDAGEAPQTHRYGRARFWRVGETPHPFLVVEPDRGPREIFALDRLTALTWSGGAATLPAAADAAHAGGR